jgi:hypothetical protein
MCNDSSFLQGVSKNCTHFTLGFELISQLKIHFQQSFCTFSMSQTCGVTKNVDICIPTAKSDKDIGCFVKDGNSKNEQVYSPLFSLRCSDEK